MAESKVPFDHVHGAARKNAVINGDMRIAQRGTSFAAIAHAAYSLDRYQYVKTGTVVHTITQDSDTPSDQFGYSLKLDCTTADASVAAGDRSYVMQKVEGYNFRKFKDQTATLSFWVKAGKTGTMCVGFRNSGPDRSYVSEVTIDSANTWERKTVTLDFDESGGTWDFTNGVGIMVSFALLGGSTYQTTADTWQTGNYWVTSNQTNFCDNTDATCDVFLSGIQLELGDQATDFEFVSYTDQLALCKRYYEKVGGDAQFPFVSSYAQGVSYYQYTPLLFETEKRAVPTLTTHGTWNLSNAASYGVGTPDKNGFCIWCQSSAAGVSSAWCNSADDFVTADAEL
jgi:hypothetical protein